MIDLVGKTVGPYQVVRRIREAPTNTVFRAYHTQLGRKVALQVIWPMQVPLEVLYQRLSAQAQVLARLSHPNIGAILECEVYDSQVILAYDFLPARVLKRRFNRPMGWDAACRLMFPAAQALACAHRQEVLHGHLSPASILLGEDGSPVLFDFGIEMAIIEEILACVPGTWIGNEVSAYLAPEQALGQNFDLRADIYAFGMVLHDLVTGSRGYAGETAVEGLVQKYTATLPDPRSHARGLPRIASAILQKSLQANPDLRFQKMQHFSSLLGKIALRQPLDHAMVHDADRRPRRSPWRWVALGLALIGLGMGGYYLCQINPHLAQRVNVLVQAIPHRAENQLPGAPMNQEVKTSPSPVPMSLTATPSLSPTRAKATTTPLVAVYEPTQTPVSSQEKKGAVAAPLPVLFGTPVPLAAEKMDPANVRRVEELARLGTGILYDIAVAGEGAGAPGTVALAASTGVYLLDAQSHALRAFLRTTCPSVSVAFQPAGEIIAVGEENGLVHLWNPTSGEDFQLTGHLLAVNDLAFTADGTLLASASQDKTVRVWKVQDRLLAFDPITGQINGVTGVSFAPDGKGMATVARDGHLRTYGIPGGQPVLDKSLGGAFLDVQYSADGRALLVAAAAMRGIQCWEVSGGARLDPLEHPYPLKEIAVSAGGRIAAIDIHRSAWVWNGEGWDKIAGQVDQLAFLPGSTLLVLGDSHSSLRFCEPDACAESPAPDIDLGALAVDLEVSPNNQYLAAQLPEKKVKIWHLPRMQFLYSLDGKLNSVNGDVFSTESDRLALADGEDAVVYRMSIGEEATEEFRFTGHTNLRGISFSQFDPLLAAGWAHDIHLWSLTSGQEIDAEPVVPSGCQALVTDKSRIIAFVNSFSVVSFVLGNQGVLCAHHHTWESTWALQRTSSIPLIAMAKERRLEVVRAGNPVEPNWFENELPGLAIDRLAISPDGMLLAVAVNDASIQLWDISRQVKLHVLQGHLGTIHHMVFSADNRYLVTSSADETIRIWGIYSGAGN